MHTMIKTIKHDFSFKNEHVIKRLKVAKYEGFQIV